MWSRSTRLSVVLALALTGTAQAQITNGPRVDAVIAYLHAACAAYQRNDAAAIDSLVADGFILTDSHGVITTKADDLRNARERLIEFTAFRNEGMQVRLYGTTAVVTGRTIITGKTRDGVTLDLEVQFTDTVILLDGRWRIVASHVSRLRPGPA